PNSPTFVNDQKSLRVSPSNARAPPWRGLPACRCARSVQAVAVEERFGLGVARHGVEAAPQDGPALGQAHALVLERLGEHQEQLEVAARVGAAHDVHVEVERVLDGGGTASTASRSPFSSAIATSDRRRPSPKLTRTPLGSACLSTCACTSRARRSGPTSSRLTRSPEPSISRPSRTAPCGGSRSA